MTSATTLHFRLLECCCATAVPRAHFTPFISRTFRPPLSIRQIHFSPSLKSKNSPFRIVPFVAQTSDWAQQEEKAEEETGAGYASDEGIEANAIDSFASKGEEEISDSDEGIEANDGGILEKGGSEDSYPEPPEEAKLFVGNLPYDVDSEKLAQLFDQAGVVEISEVIYNRQTDQSRGFGFVTMSTVEEAEKAVELFNRYDLNGRLLTVNKAAPRGSNPEKVPRTYEPSFRMYVGNLPWQVDNARLEELFSEHGKVVDARVVYDRESGRSRGFGFVTMSSESEVNDAIAALDGQNLDGRAIKVNVAEERPRRGF